mmetsp:Transcript_29447/g.44605  ORF Transcript_29447/g.44605 Transcript_29447/m.44605 type:complete len:323 (-) Transcript_29447:44-1012(-)
MLTPENVKLHSQGAALLLIWAANLIKAYAAFKLSGDEFKNVDRSKYTNLGDNFTIRDMQQITIETKIAMRKQKRQGHENFESKRKKKVVDSDDEDDDEHDEEGLDEVQKAKVAEERRRKKEASAKEKEKDKQKKAQRVGTIGNYLQSKAMNYNTNTDKLEPEKGDDKPRQLVDLTEIKKGPNFISKEKRDDQMRNEAFLRAEEERIGKAEKEAERLRKLEEAKKKDEEELASEKLKKEIKGLNQSDKKKEEQEGKLRMGQVRQLPEEIDDVIKMLTDVRFEVQDLDVLIELSKELREKRQTKFKNKNFSYASTLANAGLTEN